MPASNSSINTIITKKLKYKIAVTCATIKYGNSIGLALNNQEKTNCYNEKQKLDKSFK